ncbi:MAG: methyltransferase domain-containing protein [Planctomycetota bacterium]
MTTDKFLRGIVAGVKTYYDQLYARAIPPSASEALLADRGVSWEEKFRRLEGTGAEILLRLRYFAGEVEGIAPGRALDVGCGAGHHAAWLAGGGWRVTGVDIAAGALSLLRARGGVGAVQAEASTLPFSNGTFDLVYCGALIQNHPDGPAVLREAVRVTRPGGVVILETYNRRSVNALWCAVRRWFGWRIPWNRFMKRHELESLLEETGFQADRARAHLLTLGFLGILAEAPGRVLRRLHWPWRTGRWTRWMVFAINRRLPPFRWGDYLICRGRKPGGVANPAGALEALFDRWAFQDEIDILGGYIRGEEQDASLRLARFKGGVVADLGSDFRVSLRLGRPVIHTDHRVDTAMRLRRHVGGRPIVFVVSCLEPLCLPFRDGSVSGIIAVGHIDLCQNVPRFLGEVERVLAPGGGMILAVQTVRNTWYSIRGILRFFRFPEFLALCHGHFRVTGRYLVLTPRIFNSRWKPFLLNPKVMPFTRVYIALLRCFNRLVMTPLRLWRLAGTVVVRLEKEEPR